MGNQMTREQAGSVGSHDMRQKKRDDRVMKGEINKENTDLENAKKDNELQKNKAEYEKEDNISPAPSWCYQDQRKYFHADWSWILVGV